MKKGLFYTFVLMSVSVFGKSKTNSLIGCWYYQDAYTTKQLIIKPHHKFHYYFSSCEGDLCYNGKYECKSDTLILYSKKWGETLFLYQQGKIHHFSDYNEDFTPFQAFSKVKKQRKLKCPNDEVEIVEFKDVEE